MVFTSLLDNQRVVYNRFRHFLKANEVFWNVYDTFIYQGRYFVVFSSLLDSQRGVYNRLRHFLKASDVFFNYLRHFYLAREVFCIVYVTFR